MANHHWIYAVSGFGLLVLAYVVLALRGSSMMRRIKKARQGETIETFIHEFEGLGYSRTVLEMAYQDLAKLARMPIRRVDDLEETLGFLPEDFETMFEKRCNSLGLDEVWKSMHASMLPLKTAEDYVRFLAAVVGEQQKSRRAE